MVDEEDAADNDFKAVEKSDEGTSPTEVVVDLDLNKDGLLSDFILLLSLISSTVGIENAIQI